MHQQSKANGRWEQIAAQNAAIVRRNMPQIIYPADHPGRHEALRSVLVGLRPVPVSGASRLPEETLLARMCRQGRWDALQAAMWIHRHLLALIPNAGDLDADTLDALLRHQVSRNAVEPIIRWEQQVLPCVPQAGPRHLIGAADDEANVVLGDLVQTVDLDVVASPCQPAEVIDPGMINMDV
jgi:hypothetical protein